MKRQVDKMPKAVHRVIGFHRIEEKFEAVDQNNRKNKYVSPKNKGVGFRSDGEA